MAFADRQTRRVDKSASGGGAEEGEKARLDQIARRSCSAELVSRRCIWAAERMPMVSLPLLERNFFLSLLRRQHLVRVENSVGVE